MAVLFGGLWGLGAVFIVVVGNKPFQTPDADRLALDAADTFALALALLGADPSADGGEGRGKADDLVGALKIPFGDLFDEIGDLDVHRAAGDTGHIFAVKTALRLVDRHLGGIAQRHLVEVVVADVRVLGGHRVFGRSHIRHISGPPF